MVVIVVVVVVADCGVGVAAASAAVTGGNAGDVDVLLSLMLIFKHHERGIVVLWFSLIPHTKNVLLMSTAMYPLLAIALSLPLMKLSLFIAVSFVQLISVSTLLFHSRHLKHTLWYVSMYITTLRLDMQFHQ